MRPGRSRVTADKLALPESPTEQLLMQAEPRMLEEPEEEAAVDPVRPWEPKGLQGAQPEDTVVAEKDLVHSPPPPKTAGGSPPGTKKKFSRFDIDRA